MARVEQYAYKSESHDLNASLLGLQLSSVIGLGNHQRHQVDDYGEGHRVLECESVPCICAIETPFNTARVYQTCYITSVLSPRVEPHHWRS